GIFGRKYRAVARNQSAGRRLPFAEPGRATVLLADDDANDAELVKLAFQCAGYGNAVEEVRRGEDAINYLKGDRKYLSGLHELGTCRGQRNNPPVLQVERNAAVSRCRDRIQKSKTVAA